MPNDRSLDIDEPYDLELARLLIAHRREQANVEILETSTTALKLKP
jgi:hypothetical protein